MSRSSDRSEDVQKQEIKELKMGIIKECLKIAYLFLAFISINFLPLLLMGAITFIGVLLPGSISVSHDPLGVTIGGQGTPITQLINVLVVMEMIRNTITLYGKGVPQIITEPSIVEADADD